MHEGVGFDFSEVVLMGPSSCSVIMYIDTAKPKDKCNLERYVAGHFGIEYYRDSRDLERIFDSVMKSNCRSYRSQSLSGVKAYFKKSKIPYN